jgi:nucleotidyltransferase substrate binding protein (TIGR01987 family)
MALDFTSLEGALASLHRAIQRSQAAPNDLELRDAVILRFEYTFELAAQSLKNQLEQEAIDPSKIEQLSLKELLREAAARKLPVNFAGWVVYHAMRTITSETYVEEKAEDVYQTAVEFYRDASVLLKALKDRNRD